MPDKFQLPATLRATRMRPTAARIAIVSLLEHAVEPLHADTVFRHLGASGSGLALGTVYRALRELEDARIVQREWHEEPCGSRKAMYSLRADGDPQRSLQLVCTACGRRASVTDAGLHRQLAQAAASVGMALPAQPLTLHLARCGCAGNDNE